MGRANREFVLDRVGKSFAVNARADLPESARRNLPLEDTPVVETVEELDELTRRRYVPTFEGFADRIRESETQNGTVVVESYGDVALPIRGLSFDAVAVVEPCRMRAYDDDRFMKACEIAGGTPRDGRLEVHVPDVTDLVDPKVTARLSPLSRDERRDFVAVARAYDEAYDELVAMASG